MDGVNCEGTGGWTRVAYVNMSQAGATCPVGLTQMTLSGLTLCGRDSDTRSCAGTLFSTLGISYSRVCGQLRGYQRFTPDGFHLYNNNGNIDGANYVDGVSITYGNSPRNHIWTYACGLYLDGDRRAICPCNTNGLTSNAAFPSFIGNDYYCETGNNDNSGSCCTDLFSTPLLANDPLWDGKQCVDEEAPCCSAHPNLPWFTKTLSDSTTEDIEVRVCGNQRSSDEGTPLDVIELFVY